MKIRFLWLALFLMIVGTQAKKNKGDEAPSLATPIDQLPLQFFHPSNTTTLISGQNLIVMWTAPPGIKERIYFQMFHVPVMAIFKKNFIAQLPDVNADVSRMDWKTPNNMTTDSRFQLLALWAKNGTIAGRSQLFAVIARKEAEKWGYPLDQPPVLPMTGPFDRRFFRLPDSASDASSILLSPILTSLTALILILRF